MSDTATRLQLIMGELGEFFLEREGVLRNVVLALLTKQHVFLLGPVGSGKTQLLEDLMERITGAEFFSVQLHEQMGREEMFGPIDVPRFSAQAVWERDIDGYLPTAHLAMIDELDKGGPGVVRPLLRVINERRFRNGKLDMNLPLMSVVASANEMLPASEVAVWDRFLLRDEVSYLAEADNFVRLVNPVHVDALSASNATITLQELQLAQYAVGDVKVPKAVFEAMLQVRASLMGKGIVSSDRRWRASVAVMQASAWLEGRDEVNASDLAVLESILWQTVEHRAQVSEAVLKVGTQGQKDLARALLMVDSVADTLKARKGQSAADLGDYFGDGIDTLRKAEAKIDKAVGEVPTYRLGQARKLWRDTKVQLLVQCAGFTRAEAEEDVA
jgi:MoxR-like ATPase